MKVFVIFVCKILVIKSDSKTLSGKTELAVIQSNNVETISITDRVVIEEDCTLLSTVRDAQCGRGTQYLCSLGSGKCSDESEKYRI